MIHEIQEKLIEYDGEGNPKLMPLLMELLGAALILYGRNEVIDVPSTVGRLSLKTNISTTMTRKIWDRMRVRVILELTASQALHHNQQRS